ncbi:MAG: ExeA family protein [Acidimicrobiales bacterium]
MSVDRLCSFYGFTRMPFGRDLAPGALFRSAAHSEAVARLGWCVAEQGLGVLTGEVGSGKTVAARATVAGLDASRTQVIYCANPTVGGRGILSAVVAGLGEVPRFHRAALVPQAADALATAESERGRRVLLLIDEAHLLDPDQLEDLRMITNAEMDSRSPAAVILIGQPLLRRRLHQGAMAALDQRITLRVHMEGMNLAETLAYVRHHLSLAGRADAVFSDDAVAVIAHAGRGLPRAVNNLALQALVATFAADKAIVDASAAKMAVVEVNGE